MISCLEDHDNGQNDVLDGSVENYSFDWGKEMAQEQEVLPLDDMLIALDEQHGISDNNSAQQNNK